MALPAENKELDARLQNPETVRQAFAELVHIYTQPLYWQIRRMVSSHEDANDLLQNTFLKAWNSIENFRGDAKLSTWLYKIAINESLTFLEKERRKQSIELDDSDNGMTNQVMADEEIDGEQLSAKLNAAVADLPEKQRLVFNMKYFEDMKYEDMSQILGTSVGALKASYHLAVKKIENYFSEHD